MMKPETRTSFLNRSFRRSFRRRKTEEKANQSVNPAEEEQKAVTELRQSLGRDIQPFYTDEVLHRLLKAKKFSVKETETRIRQVQYIKKYLMQKTMDEWDFSEAIRSQKIGSIIGYDNEGSLVRYANVGSTDFKGIVHSASTVEIMAALLYILEKDSNAMVKENKKTGRNANQIVFILDLKNLSTIQILHKPVIDTAIQGILLLQEYFYEIWKSIFIINAPSYFNTVYKILKPSIIEELHSKIYVYNANNWKEALLLQIPAEVLPDCLGGTRTDYMTKSNVPYLLNQIVSVPESCFNLENLMLDPNDPTVQTITVSAGGFANIPVPIVHAGSIVKCHINSKDHDISFGIFYEAKSAVCHIEKFKKKDCSKDVLSKLEQITPIVRCHCNIKPEIWDIKAWKAGIFILHLDNTYSWMNAKQVCYKFHIIPPEPQQQREASSIINGTKNLKL